MYIRINKLRCHISSAFFSPSSQSLFCLKKTIYILNCPDLFFLILTYSLLPFSPSFFTIVSIPNKLYVLLIFFFFFPIQMFIKIYFWLYKLQRFCTVFSHFFSQQYSYFPLKPKHRATTIRSRRQNIRSRCLSLIWAQ